jgi:hypothetical protein
VTVKHNSATRAAATPTPHKSSSAPPLLLQPAKETIPSRNPLETIPPLSRKPPGHVLSASATAPVRSVAPTLRRGRGKPTLVSSLLFFHGPVLGLNAVLIVRFLWAWVLQLDA